MKAVIFAAGLGSRLYPLTKDRPKALVEVQGRPMLYRIMDKFCAMGVDSFVLNVHAFASQVEEAARHYQEENPGLKISISDESDLLLETGGGLKKMEHYLSDGPFMVHNVDILSDMDFRAFVGEADAYKQSLSEKEQTALSPLATLAVRKTESDRYFLFNASGCLCGWENVRTGEKKISRPQEKSLRRYGFMGIHYICPSIFPLMTEKGVFSITDVYLRLAAQYDIRMSDQSCSHWMDMGTPEQWKVASQTIWR